MEMKIIMARKAMITTTNEVSCGTFDTSINIPYNLIPSLFEEE